MRAFFYGLLSGLVMISVALLVAWRSGQAVPRAETVLNLSVTGSAVAMPDEMAASLQAVATAPSATAAQDAVNQMMQKALAASRGEAGVSATTAGYGVSQTDDAKQQFQASQGLNLTIAAPGGTPPAAFLELVGQLQQAGLQLQGLDGQLSPAGADAAGHAATADALHRLQDAAATAAAALGDQVAGIKTLDVQTGNSGPIMPGRMLMAMAPAAPPAAAAPGPVTIQVTVNASVALTPPAP